MAALATRVELVVAIVDAREAFARSDRFSRVATVHIGWPGAVIEEQVLGPRDAVIVFSHDPKFDEPALLAALDSEVGYVETLGSRRTAADRNERLAAAGVDAGALARIHSPCGLDIGAATPEEVAISIMAGSRRRALGPRRHAADQRPGLDPPALSSSSPGVSTSASLPRPLQSTRWAAAPARIVRNPSSPRSAAARSKRLRSSSTGVASRPP